MYYHPPHYHGHQHHSHHHPYHNHHHSDDQYNAQYLGLQSHHLYHHQPHPNEPSKIPVRTGHVPFAQRIVQCDQFNSSHSGLSAGHNQIARVHSFTTRVYVNRDPYEDARLSHFPSQQRHGALSKREQGIRSRPPSFAYRYNSAERPSRRLKYEISGDASSAAICSAKVRKSNTLPVKPKRLPTSPLRFASDERPMKRSKHEAERSVSSVQQQRSEANHWTNQSQSYFSLPAVHSRKSQKVNKTASFQFSSPFKSRAHPVKRENSLTSRLQNQARGPCPAYMSAVCLHFCLQNDSCWVF